MTEMVITTGIGTGSTIGGSTDYIEVTSVHLYGGRKH